MLIREAIEEANDSGNILKDTDDPEKHRRDIITLHMMRREYEVFDSFQKQIFEFDALVTTYSCNSVDKDVKTKNRFWDKDGEHGI